MRQQYALRGAKVFASVTTTLFVAVAALAGAPANTKAIAQLRWTHQYGPGASTLTSIVGTGVVTVGTGPTPSVMLPASLAEGAYFFSYPSYTAGSMTPYRIGFASWRNAAATLVKSHEGAANATQTFMTPGLTPTAGVRGLYPPIGPTVTGSTFAGSGRATDNCFSRNPGSTTPATSPWSQACAIRPGVLSRVPGSKRYGGTVRMLQRTGNLAAILGTETGTILSSTQGYSSLPGGPDPAQTGPSGVGNYYHARIGINTYLPGLTEVATDIQITEMPFTTGMASLHAGSRGALYYSTSVAGTGSFDLNGANLTGMISLVKPVVVHWWGRSNNTALGQIIKPFGGYKRLELTFMPEPEILAGLCAGGALLVAFARRRPRR